MNRLLVVTLFFALGVPAFADEARDLAAVRQTGDEIRAAFARSDVKAVMSYHHPDVVKALSAGPLLNGKAAVEANLRGTLDSFSLEFIKNDVESLMVHGDVAVEISQFAIRGTPRKGGDPFEFAGRAMVVYVRSADSP